MNTGVVITAAGMSSRMGSFKPMMTIGSISIAERVIATLKQAGIDLIVVITGYCADDLEHHLAHNRVIFLRNEKYATTKMFDSVIMGINYLQTKCDRILFTPIDIPLFTVDTVTALLDSKEDIAIPICNGQPGHPILISSAIAEKVVHDSGEDGLRGALQRCGGICYIEVHDQGILYDADTPDDFYTLLAYHNHQILRPVIDIKLAAERIFFDSRIAMLLFLIDNTSSMLTACRQMQISYSSGWKLINSSEEALGIPLINRWQGGSNGGKTTLTHEGSDLLDRYRKFTADIRNVTDTLFEKYFGDIFKNKE